MMRDFKKNVLTGLFAALVCVATMSIRIPTPGTGGYIHPGDALVILSGVILGPVGGFLAAGVGSAFADLLGGYFIYVPITFVIKGLIAMLSGYVFRHVGASPKGHYLAVFLGGLINTFLVVVGYGLCEVFLYSPAGALQSAIPNLIQGISGLVIALLLYPALSTIPYIRQLRS